MSSRQDEIIVFIVFMSIFVIVMVRFIIIILFSVQKKQKRFNNNLLDVKSKYDKELSKAQIESQEQIFKQMGRELHDNVGQMVSLAKLGLGGLDLERKEEVKNGTAEVMDILEKILSDVREMSRSMNFDLERNGGFIKSIEMQVGFLQRTGRCNVRLNTEGDEIKISNDKEIIIFRILQEALNNTIRHSSATDIEIDLNYLPNLFSLQICDNGKGFDLNNLIAFPNQLNGIHNMQSRAELIKADFKIDSTPGKGTIINITTKY